MTSFTFKVSNWEGVKAVAEHIKGDKMTSLSDKVARVKELDAKRQWIAEFYHGGCEMFIDPVALFDRISELEAETEKQRDDMFSMQQTIDKQREVLGMARGSLVCAKQYAVGNTFVDIEHTLIAIDNVMKGA